MKKLVIHKDTKEVKGEFVENIQDHLSRKDLDFYKPYLEEGFIPYLDPKDKRIGLVTPIDFKVKEVEE